MLPFVRLGNTVRFFRSKPQEFVSGEGMAKQVRARAAKWDINRILAAGGGIDVLIEAHEACGFEKISYSAVASWRFRQSVPAGKLAEILLTLRKSRPQLDLIELVRVIQ